MDWVSRLVKYVHVNILNEKVHSTSKDITVKKNEKCEEEEKHENEVSSSLSSSAMNDE